jgi:cell wall assembly regulator SMI1
VGDGCDEAEIRHAERRLGVTLPKVLRDGYRIWGRRDDLSGGMLLLPPDRLLLDADAKVLVYQQEQERAAGANRVIKSWASRTAPSMGSLGARATSTGRRDTRVIALPNEVTQAGLSQTPPDRAMRTVPGWLTFCLM